MIVEEVRKEQGLCEEVEWIGTKQGEGCIESEGGGGFVGDRGYGGEGRGRRTQQHGLSKILIFASGGP